MRNMNGTRAWHTRTRDDELEEYIMYDWNDTYDGYMIRRPGRSLGRFRGLDTVFPMNKP